MPATLANEYDRSMTTGLHKQSLCVLLVCARGHEHIVGREQAPLIAGTHCWQCGTTLGYVGRDYDEPPIRQSSRCYTKHHRRCHGKTSLNLPCLCKCHGRGNKYAA
jgi:hypothetical protein